jgi:hypothetical protein
VTFLSIGLRPQKARVSDWLNPSITLPLSSPSCRTVFSARKSEYEMSEQKDIKHCHGVLSMPHCILNYVLHDQFKRMSDLPRIIDSHEAVTYLQEHFQHVK